MVSRKVTWQRCRAGSPAAGSTSSGQELFPVLLALREWGERQLQAGDAPVNPVWHKCGAELHVEPACGACRDVVILQDLRYR